MKFVDCGRGGFGEGWVGTEVGEQREDASLEENRYVCGHFGGRDIFHAGFRCGRVLDRFVKLVCCLGQPLVLQFLVIYET